MYYPTPETPCSGICNYFQCKVSNKRRNSHLAILTSLWMQQTDILAEKTCTSKIRLVINTKLQRTETTSSPCTLTTSPQWKKKKTVLALTLWIKRFSRVLRTRTHSEFDSPSWRRKKRGFSPHKIRDITFKEAYDSYLKHRSKFRIYNHSLISRCKTYTAIKALSLYTNKLKYFMYTNICT